MWVIGFTLFIDNMDQYIVRGSSNQIKARLRRRRHRRSRCSSRAFILVNGIVTMPAGYLATAGTGPGPWP